MWGGPSNRQQSLYKRVLDVLKNFECKVKKVLNYNKVVESKDLIDTK